jgi:hypothetical protein
MIGRIWKDAEITILEQLNVSSLKLELKCLFKFLLKSRCAHRNHPNTLLEISYSWPSEMLMKTTE